MCAVHVQARDIILRIVRWLTRGNVVEKGKEGREGEGRRSRRSDVSHRAIVCISFLMLMDYSRRMLVLPVQPQPRVCPFPPLLPLSRLIPFDRKHLIVSIGTECYVTLPKGQLIPTQSGAVDNSDISTVPGGGHVLIVPIAHHPTYSTIPADIAPPILEETNKCVLQPFIV